MMTTEPIVYKPFKPSRDKKRPRYFKLYINQENQRMWDVIDHCNFFNIGASDYLCQAGIKVYGEDKQFNVEKLHEIKDSEQLEIEKERERILKSAEKSRWERNNPGIPYHLRNICKDEWEIETDEE